MDPASVDPFRAILMGEMMPGRLSPNVESNEVVARNNTKTSTDHSQLV